MDLGTDAVVNLFPPIRVIRGQRIGNHRECGLLCLLSKNLRGSKLKRAGPDGSSPFIIDFSAVAILHLPAGLRRIRVPQQPMRNRMKEIAPNMESVTIKIRGLLG